MKLHSNHRINILGVLAGLFLIQQTALAIPREGRGGSINEPVFRTTSPTILDLGAGIMVGEGTTLPGVDLQIAARLNTATRLYVGGEMGLFLYSGTGSSAAVIPILATLFTEFDASNRVHPMLGVSVGPTLSTGGGYSTARFTMLINPGVRFDMGGSAELNTQIRFGVIGSTFVTIPQVGISLAI